ncbi:MAG: hypothetical protein H0T97_02405 [Actinobacteria bacterium]|nr:hypothetical protein [Actinomycetota bacterium]
MATKRQQTMAKLTRERNVKEKRERKLEKKRNKKLAAAEGGEPMVEFDEFGMPIVRAEEPLATPTDD